MQHERDYDKRTATPNVRTLDDIARDAAQMDRFPSVAKSKPNFSALSEAEGEQLAQAFRSAADPTELRRLLKAATKPEDLDELLGPAKITPTPGVVGTFDTSPLGLSLRRARNTARRWFGLKPKHNFKV